MKSLLNFNMVLNGSRIWNLPKYPILYFAKGQNIYPCGFQTWQSHNDAIVIRLDMNSTSTNTEFTNFRRNHHNLWQKS